MAPLGVRRTTFPLTTRWSAVLSCRTGQRADRWTLSPGGILWSGWNSTPPLEMFTVCPCAVRMTPVHRRLCIRPPGLPGNGGGVFAPANSGPSHPLILLTNRDVHVGIFLVAVSLSDDTHTCLRRAPGEAVPALSPLGFKFAKAHPAAIFTPHGPGDGVVEQAAIEIPQSCQRRPVRLRQRGRSLTPYRIGF